MKFKQKILLLIILFAFVFPLLAQAQLVPCGRAGQQPCTWDDLATVVIHVINYMLSASAIVALYYVLMSAWEMVSAMGNPEK
ncbi:MAG: hypothetical protein AAB871_01655, partial [Patescibacteria group bacterium]